MNHLIEDDVSDWVDTHLLKINPPRDLASSLKRIRSELDEAQEALEKGDTFDVLQEIADVVISCFAAVRLHNEHVSLTNFIKEKMRINRARKWEIGPDGQGRHVKDRPEEEVSSKSGMVEIASGTVEIAPGIFEHETFIDLLKYMYQDLRGIDGEKQRRFAPLEVFTPKEVDENEIPSQLVLPSYFGLRPLVKTLQSYYHRLSI
jgi:NTP pyrophosphatase (non-canonical NTP hydrolase)